MARRAATTEERLPEGMCCRIQARVENVFCCGQRHGTRAVLYPEGWFNERQLAELAAHPDLTVTRRA